MSSYREQLPKELRKLIAHTEKGVERLYRAARTSPLDRPEEEKRRKRNKRRYVAEYSSSSSSASENVVGYSSYSESEDEQLDDREELSRHGTRRTKPVQHLKRHHRALSYTNISGNSLPGHHGRHYNEALDNSNVAATSGNVTSSSVNRSTAQEELQQPTRPQRSSISLLEIRDQQKRSVPSGATSRANESTLSAGGGGGGDTTQLTAMRSTFGRRWNGTYQSLLTPTASLQATPDSSPKSGLGPPAVQQTPPPLQPAGVIAHAETLTPPAAGQMSTLSPKGEASVQAAEMHSLKELVDKLRDEVREKEKLVLEAKLAHANEVAALREAMAASRSEAVKDVSEQLASSYAVKQSILQSAKEAESQRVAELEEELRVLRKEHTNAKRNLEDQRTEVLMRDRAQQLHERELQVARQKVEDLQQYIEEVKLNGTRDRLELQALRERAAEFAEKEGALRQQLAETEAHLREQEELGKSTLRQLEEEFNHTSDSYQTLLSDTSKRMAYLEKVQRKYKALKDNVDAIEEEKATCVEAYEKRLEEMQQEVESLQKENRSLREQLMMAEESQRKARSAHDEKVADLQRQLDTVSLKGEERTKTLQLQLETSNHTIQLLKTRIESLNEEVRSGNTETQEVTMRMAEQELKLNRDMAELQKSAAAYKSHSEDTIASLRRQLKAKDAKLQALATSAAEPVQRLRQQLDDERGKRANLEDMLSRYKKKAKEAEEKAAMELRREQLRHSTELAAAALTTMGSGRSHLSDTPTPRTTTHTRGSPIASPHSAAEQQKPRSPMTWSAASHRSGSRCTPTAGDAPRVSASRDRDGHSPPQVQTTSIGDSHARSSTGHSTPAKRRGSTPKQQRLMPPAAMPKKTVPHKEHSHNTSATQLGSLSDISKTSPCYSTSRLEEDSRFEGKATVAAAAPASSSLPSEKQQGSARSGTQTPTGAGRRLLSPSPAATAPDEEAGQLLGEQVMEGAGVSEHERRLNDFHHSAADVFRKITSSRDEFLSQCVAIVHRTGDQYPRRVAQREEVEGDEGSLASTATSSRAE